MLRRLLYALPLVAALTAGAQTTTITASNIVDISGQPLAAGNFQLTPIGSAGHAIAFEANGKQYGMVAHSWAVTNGVAATITVPDTADAFPGIGYQVQILDNSAPVPKVIASYPTLIFPTGGTWSFDAWQPGAAPIYSTGASIDFGSSVPAHCSGSSSGYTDGPPPTAYYCVAGTYIAGSSSGGGGSFPTAASANQALLSTGAGTTYHAVSLAAVALSNSYSDLTSKPTIPSAVSIDGQVGTFTFTGAGVSHTGTAYTFTGASGGASTPATSNLLKGNGSANGVVAATPGTDYVIPSALGTAAAQSTSAFDAAGAAATAQTNAEAALTGDVTKSANAFVTTMATVNSNTGACGDSTHVCQVTLDGKGRATAASAVAISAGLSNPMTASGDMIGGGVSGAPARIAAPTVGTVPYNLIEVPGSAPVFALAGLGGRTVTTTTDTIAATDRGSSVTYNSASAVAVTLTSAATLGNNFDFVVGNLGAGTVTFTPGAGTVNGGSTLAVAQNESCAVNSQDNTNYVARCGYSTTSSGGASTPATSSLLKGNGSANGVVAATPGTDYQAALGFTPVANTVTVNGHALSSSVTVSATDITTGTLPNAQLATSVRTRALGWSFGDVATGSALTTSEVGYVTVPFACTVTGWHIMADAGTDTVKVARVNGGTALPTSSNFINTSGVSLSTGTKVDSTTVTDFTSTAIAANDTLGFFLITTSGTKQLTVQLDCAQ